MTHKVPKRGVIYSSKKIIFCSAFFLDQSLDDISAFVDMFKEPAKTILQHAVPLPSGDLSNKQHITGKFTLAAVFMLVTNYVLFETKWKQGGQCLQLYEPKHFCTN